MQNLIWSAVMEWCPDVHWSKDEFRVNEWEHTHNVQGLFTVRSNSVVGHTALSKQRTITSKAFICDQRRRFNEVEIVCVLSRGTQKFRPGNWIFSKLDKLDSIKRRFIYLFIYRIVICCALSWVSWRYKIKPLKNCFVVNAAGGL